ncbi:hypothetical protein HMI55_004923, partial [Coelomomyces lativittatus]
DDKDENEIRNNSNSQVQIRKNTSITRIPLQAPSNTNKDMVEIFPFQAIFIASECSILGFILCHPNMLKFSQISK